MLGRALFHSANYWQDEAAVFLLVGATFMTSAYVQSQRGHIGIEAFVGLLPPFANRIRLWLVDVASFAVLRLLRMEILDAGLRGLGRGPGFQFDVVAATRHPLQPDGNRHDAVMPANPAADRHSARR